MTFRAPKKTSLLAAIAAGQRPPMLPQAGNARVNLELQQLERGGMAFTFSKRSLLGAVFPTSSSQGSLVPREIDPRIQLTHPALSKSAQADLFDSFQIAGAAGVGFVTGSEVPFGKITYYQPGALGASHNDAGALDILIGYSHVDKGFTHVVRIASLDGPPAGVPGGVRWSNHAPFIVPSGYRPFINVLGLGGAAVATLTGMTIVLDVHDEVPPGF